jgi:cytochrome c
MKRLVFLLYLFCICTLLFAATGAWADEKADAVKMVKSAASYLNTQGLEKALDAINDPKGAFFKGELYVFAFDLSGILLANPAKPDMVGQNVLDVPDSTGKRFRREFIELAKRDGSGWVDYKILNPKTKAIESKTSYIEKSGDVVLGCGIYKK